MNMTNMYYSVLKSHSLSPSETAKQCYNNSTAMSEEAKEGHFKVWNRSGGT